VRAPTLIALLALLGCGSVSQKDTPAAGADGGHPPVGKDGGQPSVPVDAAVDASAADDGGAALDAGLPVGAPAGWDSPAARWDQTVWR
jgi:hypothetical protein